jgi:glutamate-1-semialdehyde 2,1-aminomutase
MNIINEGYAEAEYFFKKGIGPYIFDQKNDKFLDLSSAGGTSLLGHNNKIFKKSLKDFLNKNFSNFSLPNLHAKNLSITIQKILPQFSKIIFCNSGAEANMKAIRIARAVTGKDKIINISGSWHGSIDQFLLYKNINGRIIRLSSGLEKNIEKKIIYAPYNNFYETKKIITKNKNNICCVLVEPIQGCLPSDQNINYLKLLSNYCDREKIILIFDEIITGLRTECSSVQNYYKFVSDISTFGKAFGNSLPIGFIGITKKIEEKIKRIKLKIFFGGTYSANSLSTYVANSTLNYLIKNKKKVFSVLENISNKFCYDLNNKIISKNINARVIRFKSIIRIIFSENIPKDRLQRDFFEKNNNFKRIKFINFLKKKKIYFPSNGIIFLNTSFSSKELDYLLKQIIEGLKKCFK